MEVCWTLMTFHGHGFELVVGVAHMSMHAFIKYERQYMWETPTTNSQNHVHETSSHDHNLPVSLLPLIFHA